MITFNGVEFHERGYRVTPGEDAVLGVTREGLQGFQDVAEVTGETVRVSGSHGEYDGPTYLSGAVRTISGVALARTRAQLQHLHDRVAGLALAGTQRLTWDREGFGESSRWCEARVMGAIEWHMDPHRRAAGYWVAEFLIQLRSARPWWYGMARHAKVRAGETLELVNRGNAPAFPHFVVGGPMQSGWSLEAAGQRVTSVQQLAPSEACALYSDAGVGFNAVGQLWPGLRGVVPTLPPGAHVLTFDGAGSGTTDVHWTDTYL